MNICVFAGSSCGKRGSYQQAAEQLGERLAHRAIGLVAKIRENFVQQETFAYFGKRPRIIVHFNCWIRTDADIPRITQDRSRIALLNPVSPEADFDSKASADPPTMAVPENEDQ